MILAVFEDLPPKAGEQAFKNACVSVGLRILLGSLFHTAFQREACVSHGPSIQTRPWLLRSRENEPGMRQSRLLTHLRPHHNQTRPAGVIKKPDLCGRCLSHHSGGPGAVHRASVFRNPPSAQWRGQSISQDQERT